MCGIFDQLNKLNPMAHIGGKDNKFRQLLAPQSPRDLVQGAKMSATPWKHDPILNKLRGRNDIPPPNDIINPPVQGYPKQVKPQFDQQGNPLMPPQDVLGNIRFGGG